MNEKLIIAVQKQGRLNQRSLDLIKKCGIGYSGSNGQLRVPADNFPLDIIFLRDDDIPGYVSDGVADIGLVGLNEVEEKGKPVRLVKGLGYSRCRLSIAVPEGREYTGLHDLRGLRIATSHPSILGKFLRQRGIDSDIHEIKGSVEIAPSIGLTDAVCDLVSSGTTLQNNNLKEVEMVLRSEAVLIAGESTSRGKQALLDKLMLRINAVQKADQNKYILLNAPENRLNDIIRLLPGMKSPTISPLWEKGWVSVQSVVSEDKFWEIVEKLNCLGAQGILMMPIEKMVF